MAGFQKRFNVSLVVAREAYVMMVLAVFATTALCCAAQAQPPANTSAVLPADASLNEFKNSTAVTSVNDPGDAPEAPCPLAASDLAQADLLSVNSSCGDTMAPSFCSRCGCALSDVPFNALQSRGLLRGTLNDTGVLHDTLDACGRFAIREVLSTGSLAAGSLAPLAKCDPLVFVCQGSQEQLNSSLITGSVTDNRAIIGGAVADAVEEASQAALPGVPRPPLTASGGLSVMPAPAALTATAALTAALYLL